MIDLWTSRRKSFIKCKYWQVDIDERYVKSNEIAHKKMPLLEFHAEYYGNVIVENQEIEGSFMVRTKHFMIRTTDKVSEIKENGIVELNNELYRVENISSKPLENQQQYIKSNQDISKEYFISLRG